MTVSLESIIRPFVVVESLPREELSTGEVTDLGTLAPVSLTWGQAADLSADASGVITAGDNSLLWEVIKVGSGGGWDMDDILRDFDEVVEDEQAEDETSSEVFEYREVSRKVVSRRVSNPADSTQWVDVEDASEIVFEASDGRRLKLVFDTGGG